LQAERKKMLEDLKQKGFTVDENGGIVDLPKGDSESSLGQEDILQTTTPLFKNTTVV
jgi:uncharacterized protein (UPF0335 family)